ncbi:1-acyl-sn-glycerol-3-phosphate acyltransferase [Kangiella profundi]|uniref:1-acyl-sn-glycerol-3-phosphate acyltransferase n=1 Tax=Kangiella profundi TaxID=1561924 RepID=A0A2K9ACJ8_9GAMM|nr:lysophospholipid acyltransferase family protein [Kangiella profundi]AUD79167.1 1-acyl-sn-glycerol-3-phosphate acyltransferase [Kangiella profundi]MBD3669033.1 1-acyl-sn-glycerol-3-phosphate acyltransferase [Kangiella sp.]GGF00929.1 1-acyl-sn-glycerol-3-phosphate acyltransferase [Kangiella profundi]
MNSTTQTASQTDKQPRPAGFLRALWVITYSIAATAKYSLKTLYFAFFSKKDLRTKVDKILVDWSGRLIRAARINWQVEGDLEQQVQEGRRVIIMCNHSSAYDIPLAFTALPGSIRMISKKELFSVPLLSSAMKAAEILSINRQNRQQAIEDLKIAREKMESGIRIWMFPEGTRSKNGELIPLKKGGIRLAIDTNALIIPVVMQDIYKVLPNKKWLKMRLHQPVKVKVGEAIDCREFDVEHRHELSDLVYNSMKRMLEERSS